MSYAKVDGATNSTHFFAEFYYIGFLLEGSIDLNLQTKKIYSPKHVFWVLKNLKFGFMSIYTLCEHNISVSIPPKVL